MALAGSEFRFVSLRGKCSLVYHARERQCFEVVGDLCWHNFGNTFSSPARYIMPFGHLPFASYPNMQGPLQPSPAWRINCSLLCLMVATKHCWHLDKFWHKSNVVRFKKRLVTLGLQSPGLKSRVCVSPLGPWLPPLLVHLYNAGSLQPCVSFPAAKG